MLIKFKADGVIYDRDYYINPAHIASINSSPEREDIFNEVFMGSGDCVLVNDEQLNTILNVIEVRPDEIQPIYTDSDQVENEND